MLEIREGYAIEKATASGDYSDPAYVEAEAEYMRLHAAKTPGNDAPDCLSRIPESRWELFRTCRHMYFVEENEQYIKMLKDWLNANDRIRK